MRIKECERNWGRKPGDRLATKIEGLFRDDSWVRKKYSGRENGGGQERSQECWKVQR